MKTKPIYLEDSYKKELETKVLEVTNSSGTYEVILAETIFYPFGGGQPSDQGALIINDTEAKVIEVRLTGNEVIHIVKSEIEINKGDEVTCKIDWDRRYRNMKVHSAGHIIDFAFVELGLNPQELTPLKASHGSKAEIVYKGKIQDDTKAKLERKVQEIIDKKLEFSWKFTDLADLEKNAVYLQPGLPSNKPLRMLTLESIGSVADGGTIVKNTGEIEGIEINEITHEGENCIVKYSVVINSEMKKNDVKSGNVSLSGQFLETLENIKNQVRSLNSEETLTSLWREYLGKNGKVKDLMEKIKEIPAEERKDYGQSVNSLRNEIDNLINSAKNELKKGTSSEYLNQPQAKLSNKKQKVGHLHPLTETINEINNIFKKLGYSVYDGPELETDEYLFQRCNLPLHHPARDLQDSIFVDEPNILLRTQTSSVEAHALEELEPPFKIVVPGRVYRNEKVNKSNHFLFHQYQLVCVQEKVSLAELFSTVTHMFKEFYGDDVQIRFRTKYYPEVEPGAGVDMLCPFCKGAGCVVCKKRGWLEMAGSGIIHPNMMRMAGLDTDKWQGFAFGFGLDRLAMTKHNIQDIRTLLGGDLAYKTYVR